MLDHSAIVDSNMDAAMPSPDPVEEYEDDQPTDVEKEEKGDGLDVTNPWDPTAIRVDPKVYSLRQIVDMIDEGDLELAPDFQRNRVWDSVQRSRLIESILLRIPLPAFYFSAADTGSLQVVDGLQRLSSIHDYVKDKFPLTNLEYLGTEVGGCRFADLRGSLWARRITSTQITANVVDPQTPDRVKFDIFKRINTGGSPLNAQEIRHCMSNARSRDFLKRLSELDEFNRATSGKLQHHIRMVDREVVLRFCAFRLYGADYSSHDTVDAFLTDVTKRIDSFEVSDATLNTLTVDFRRAMTNAFRLFGQHAFRKWPALNDRLNPFNRPLFESWSVALADYDWGDLAPHAAEIVKKARMMMTVDGAFLDAITASTSTRSRVQLRFERVAELLEEVVSHD